MLQLSFLCFGAGEIAAVNRFMIAVKPRWANYKTAKLVKNGPNVIHIPTRDLSKHPFNAPRGKNYRHSERGVQQIAPGVRNALFNGDCCARWSIQGLVSIGDM